MSLANRIQMAPRVGIEPTSLVLIQSQAGPTNRPTEDQLLNATHYMLAGLSPDVILDAPQLFLLLKFLTPKAHI